MGLFDGLFGSFSDLDGNGMTSIDEGFLGFAILDDIDKDEDNEFDMDFDDPLWDD